jgi:hypothetical protein
MPSIRHTFNTGWCEFRSRTISSPGAAAVLVKPFRIEALLDVVEEFGIPIRMPRRSLRCNTIDVHVG